MKNAPGIALAVLLFGAACVLSVGSAVAQTTPAPSGPAAMPPGMTPESMRMMMTPGVKDPKGLPAGLTLAPRLGYGFQLHGKAQRDRLVRLRVGELPERVM